MDQASEGDITIDYELAFGLDGHYTQVKLIPTNNPTVPIATIQHKMDDDIVVVFPNSADNITIPFVYIHGKRWKMVYNRSASTVSVYSDAGSGYVQHGVPVAVPVTTDILTFSLYTNVLTTSTDSTVALIYQGSHSGIVDAHITPLCKRTVLWLGDYTTKTAYYRTKMIRLPDVMRDRLVFYADGVPLTLNVLSDNVPGGLWTFATVPGNVYISPHFGGLLFDDSEVGKVITCDPISIPKPASD